MNPIDRYVEWRDARKRKRLADYMLRLEGLTVDLEEGRVTVNAAIGGPPVQLFAASMIAWFKETGGRNYVTCEMKDRKSGQRYEITMQRCGGITPAVRISELERRLSLQGGAK